MTNPYDKLNKLIGLYKCPLCPKQTLYYHEMKEHLLVKHDYNAQMIDDYAIKILMKVFSLG